jgi:hypothetical protein
MDAARALGFGMSLALASCGGEPERMTPADGGPSSPDLATCVADGPIGVPRDGCPNELPTDVDCATASPIYDDVAPIFAVRCTICHRPSGLETMHRFDSYGEINASIPMRSRTLTQVYACRMPPSCAPDLSPDERSTMLKWFVCGAPENRDAGTD